MSRLSRELREQRQPHPKPENVVRGAKRAANRQVLAEVAGLLEQRQTDAVERLADRRAEPPAAVRVQSGGPRRFTMRKPDAPVTVAFDQSRHTTKVPNEGVTLEPNSTYEVNGRVDYRGRGA